MKPGAGLADLRSGKRPLPSIATHPGMIALCYFLALGVVSFVPILRGGYLLQLDMIFAPDTSYLEYAIREKGPLYYGRLPFAALLDVVTLVLADWIVQRVVLVLAIAGSGLALYHATSGLSHPARIFGGTLYAINPFIYVRLLAGQWYIVLGYAVLPLAVLSFYRYARGDRSRPTAPIAWATLVAIFDPHMAVVLALIGLIVLVFLVRDRGIAPLRRALIFGVFSAGVNAYWIAPAGYSLLTGSSPIATIGSEDLIAFSVRGTVANNVALSVVMLYGFWRGGYIYPFDIVPMPVITVLFAMLLFFAIYGWLDRRDPLGDALVTGVIAGSVLAIGPASSWTEPVAHAVVNTPLGAGMRETGKFVVLLALGYAFLGARGVDALQTKVVGSVLASGWRDGETHIDGRRVVAVALILIVVATPLAYTFPMIGGFWGGFEPVNYPDDWHSARADVDVDGEQRILVLPWHQYIYFDWAERTVANPAPMFFGGPVISSHDPDMGVGSLATDPTRAQVRDLLEDEHDSLGSALAPLGIEYVILLRAADHERYDYLYEQPDLTVMTDSEELVVFSNEAFADAPPPSEWPSDGSEVPMGAFVFGVIASLGASVGILIEFAPVVETSAEDRAS